MYCNRYLSIVNASHVLVTFLLFSLATVQAVEPTDKGHKIGLSPNEPASIDNILKGYFELQQCIPELVRLAIYSENEEVAGSALSTAVRTLGIEHAEDPEAIAEIIRGAIVGGTMQQKETAFTILSASGEVGKSLTPLLVHTLRTRPDNFGAHAANALGGIGEDSAGVVAELLRAYKGAQDGNNPTLRAEAGLALARLGVTSVIGELVKETQSKYPSLKIRAITGLGFYQAVPEDATKALCRAVKSESDESIKVEALKALSNHNCGENALVAQAILNGLEDKSTMVRRCAITATGKLKMSDEAVLKKLVDMAAKTRNALLYIDIREALVASGDNGIPALRRILKDENYEQKKVAAEALVRISADGVRVLIESHLHGGAHENWVATETLGTADAYVDLAEPVLLKALENNYLSYMALNAIAELKYKTGRWIETLCKIVRDPTYDEPTRKQALALIRDKELSGPQVEEALRMASRDKDVDIAKLGKELLELIEKKGKQPINKLPPAGGGSSDKAHKGNT